MTEDDVRRIVREEIERAAKPKVSVTISPDLPATGGNEQLAAMVRMVKADVLRAIGDLHRRRAL